MYNYASTMLSKIYGEVTWTVIVSDFCTKSVETVGVVNRKSRGPVVREADDDEAVRYVSVAWKVIYVEPVVVDISSWNISEPGAVPSVHVVPPVAFPDFTFITALEPSLETVCVSPCATVVVAVLSATDPNAIVPSVTDTARLLAVTVAATVAVEAARAVYPQNTNNAKIATPPISTTARFFPKNVWSLMKFILKLYTSL